MQLTGLHHLTAVTGNAPLNLDFYTRVLGLRLVKRTVNQDDVSAYHLFYADALGSPGTDVTFFDWPQIGAHVPGSSDISTTSLRVAGEESLHWWSQRLEEEGMAHDPVQEIGGRQTLQFADPEGQRLCLVDDGGAPGGSPWEGSTVSAEHFIRGLHSVMLTVRRLEPTAQVLTTIMGMRLDRIHEREDGPISVYAMAEGGPGAEVHVAERPSLPRAVVAAGGVHHVAFRTPNAEEQAEWLQRIRMAGIPTSDLVDRFYFRSLYFREPNGILFEIATDGPGFAADEDPAHLGERLALPPFLEPRRRQIEEGLKPLSRRDG